MGYPRCDKHSRGWCMECWPPEGVDKAAIATLTRERDELRRLCERLVEERGVDAFWLARHDARAWLRDNPEEG